MQKLKDLIYDKNDIFIAMIIIVIAGFVMMNRINVILDYPSTMAASNASASVSDSKDNTPQNPDSPEGLQGPATDGDGTTENPASTTTKAGAKKPASGEVVNYSIYIEPGSSAASIGEILLSVKLVESKAQFVEAVNTSNIASKLHSGTFVIPSDSTLEKTLAILTH